MGRPAFEALWVLGVGFFERRFLGLEDFADFGFIGLWRRSFQDDSSMLLHSITIILLTII